MNSQIDDYLKHSSHWIYAVGIQDVVKTRTKSLKTVIVNTLCSRCLHFQIFIRSCSSPGTSRIDSFLDLSQTVTILNEYDTDTNCNNCVSQKVSNKLFTYI